MLWLVEVHNTQQSPWIWMLPGGREVNRFHFAQIEMFKLSPQDLRQVGHPALLALFPLTREGATREVVAEMLQDLDVPEYQELALLGCGLAELVFMRTSRAGLEWLKRRFRVLHDMVRQSYIFRKILEEIEEEGLEKGMKQGLEQGEPKDLRESIVSFVLVRYPNLEGLAEKQVTACEDRERLKLLRTNLYMARSAKKVKQHLLALHIDRSGEA